MLTGSWPQWTSCIDNTTSYNFYNENLQDFTWLEDTVAVSANITTHTNRLSAIKIEAKYTTPPVKSITSNDGLACHCTMALELPRLIIMAPHEYACCMIEMSQMANPMKRPQSDNDNRTATVTCVFMRARWDWTCVLYCTFTAIRSIAERGVHLFSRSISVYKRHAWYSYSELVN